MPVSGDSGVYLRNGLRALSSDTCKELVTHIVSLLAFFLLLYFVCVS